MATTPPPPPTDNGRASEPEPKSKSNSNPKSESGRFDLADSLKALREATSRLAAAVPAPAPAPAREPSEETQGAAKPTEASPGSVEDSEAQIYYQRLEQTGKLADIASDEEIPGLPPHVTHVRRPDGSIQRIGYSIG